MRFYNSLDQKIRRFDKLLKTLLPEKAAFVPPTPAENKELSAPERRHSASLMRVNHSGEICAQALYLGQALTARDQLLAQQLSLAAKEEQDHLSWCKNRIVELGGKPSLLNPFWGLGAFMIGSTAGLLGDKVSLGFLAETERQVSHHLEKHLSEISLNDKKSRAILAQMRLDEEKHATTAMALGGIPFPRPVRKAMAMLSKIMTTTSRFI